MRLFLKFAALAIGIQILLFIFALVIVNLSPGHNSVAGDVLLFLYWPMIMLIETVGAFKGESAMIDPPMFGIPLGILIYGIIVGLIVSYLKRNKISTSKVPPGGSTA